MARSLSIQFSVKDLTVDKVVALREVHRVGEPAHLEIEEIIGQEARLHIGFPGESTRAFAGVVEEATVIGTSVTEHSAHQYVLKVVPHLAQLARSVDSRIFQEKDVKEIITQVLTDHGVTKQDWRLLGSYPKRVYCVQYQESALAFVTRL